MTSDLPAITNIISSSNSNTHINDQQDFLKTEYKKRLVKIDQFLNKLTQKKEFSGSLLISKHGQLLLSKGYGFSDYLTLSNLNTFETVYEVGSLTKEFTALIMLKLDEFRLVNLNEDYLSKYLPKYPHSHQIRIEMLLQHTSGIKDYTELPLFEKILSPGRNLNIPIQIILSWAQSLKILYPRRRNLTKNTKKMHIDNYYINIY
ncbi:unnamed protein product [Didymodactylos carnosus]|uniref:Beta-lactamase-related domain-containing protein n=1 Tax=Didymodactylos carnosus TaxID=1234261 RepID=A0A8S2YLN3_9BILA|nr:unnamed protein product [Didymodactylos carnosus]